MRLFFQPAEEIIPGGAIDVLEQGGMDGVDAVFAVHCDPSLDVGRVGLREGPITAAADRVTVHLSGRGGHTSRPHLTEDLTFALAKVITEVPAVLSRRLDPRSGLALVWGEVRAGSASNVIPSSGLVAGTLRMLDADAWKNVGPMLESIVAAVVAPYAVTARLEHVPASRRWSTTRTPSTCCVSRHSAPASSRSPRPSPSGERTSPGTSPPSRRHGPAGHPDLAARPTTCTRATS